MRNRLVIAVAAAATLLLGAQIADAANYTGHWPLTVSESKNLDGIYCLEVTDDGGNGLAYLEIDNEAMYGTFQIVGNQIVVTNEGQGVSYNAGLVFTAKATNGKLGKGVYDNVVDGESYDTGAVAFGKKGGC